MDLFANELSFHGQFQSPREMRAAIDGIMKMRQVAHRFRRELYCRKGLTWARPVCGHKTLQESLQFLTNAERGVVMSWLTKGGPFWDDIRQHGPNDYFRCGDEIVTDSSVGEAAFRALHGVTAGLVSATPSDWDHSPVEVVWERDDPEANRVAKIENWRDTASLEDALTKAAPVPRSWVDLGKDAVRRFRRLTFAEDWFVPLQVRPFNDSSARRVLVLLDILDRLAIAFDDAGERTAEGHRIYRNYFTGEKALFSDSSDSEKRVYRQALTFPNPDRPGEYLFCPWHGKESGSLLRLHFSWPIRHSEPVYVVYVGRKKTTK